MNERDRLLNLFNAAMPTINEIIKKEKIYCKVRAGTSSCLFVTFAMGLVIFSLFFLVTQIIDEGIIRGIGTFIFTMIFLLPFYLLVVGAIFWRRKLEKEINMLKSDKSVMFIPYTYRTGTIMSELYTIVSNMRADTLKEAINIWEEEEHYRRVETSLDNAIIFKKQK